MRPGGEEKSSKRRCPDSARILRVMPNTPAMIGQGMIVFEAGDTLTPEEKAFAAELFASVGDVITIESRLMDAVTAVSGSGPAYVYLFIEALADAGVKAGLPRETAQKLAARTVRGAAGMVGGKRESTRACSRTASARRAARRLKPSPYSNRKGSAAR